MKAEIETVLAADEAARQEVEAAAAEAERMRSEARAGAEAIGLRKRGELSESIGLEEEAILAEARLKADRIVEEAARYMERLQDKYREVQDELLENLLEKVIRT